MSATVGTTDQVVRAFVNGQTMRTTLAQVPGGCRVSVEDGTLYSYRTQVAVRENDNRVLVTTRRYSVTTSKLMSKVRGALYSAGFRMSQVEAGTFTANVPGRWGGFGPAWHATGYETVYAEVWTR